MDEYFKNTVRGVFWVFLFTLISSIFAYLFRIYLAHNIPIEEFGLYFSLVAFFGLLMVIKDLGLLQSAYYFIPRFIAKSSHGLLVSITRKIFFIETLSAFFVMMIIILLSDFLAANYFGYGRSIVIILFAIAFFFNSIELIYQTLFNAMSNPFMYAFQNMIRNFFLYLFIVLLGASNIDLVIMISIIFYALMVLVFGIIFRKYYYSVVGQSLQKKDMTYKKLFSFSIPATFATLGFMLLSYTDTLILTKFRTLTEVGIYNAVVPIIGILMFIPTVLVSVILPVLSEMSAKKYFDRAASMINNSIKYTLILILPVVVTVTFYPEITINILFGESFISGSDVLIIFALCSIFYAIGITNMNALLALNGSKQVMKLSLAILISNATLGFVLIPKYGIIGAALSTGISYIIMFIYSGYLLSRNQFYKLKVPYLKLIFSTSLFVFCVYLLKNYIEYKPFIEMTIVLLLSLFIYAISLLFFKVINFKDIRNFLKF